MLMIDECPDTGPVKGLFCRICQLSSFKCFNDQRGRLQPNTTPTLRPVARSREVQSAVLWDLLDDGINLGKSCKGDEKMSMKILQALAMPIMCLYRI